MAKALPHAASAGAGDWKMPEQMKRWKQGKQGKKNRHAYNTYVQRDRLQQFYDRKKVLGKYKRACRFEAKTNSAGDASGHGSSQFRPELLQKGVDEWEQEYERRMALSFGDSASSSNATHDASGTAPRKKRRGRDRAVDTTEVVEEVGAEEAAADQLHRSQRRKLKGTKLHEAHGITEASKPIAQKSAQTAQAQDVVYSKPLKKKKKKGSTGLPDRFSKDLKQFDEKREAEAKEQQRRRDEEFSRKRQRRETAKGRAMKGQLLSQRTARGQPKMQGILEAITGKLASEQQQKPLRHSSERAPVSSSGRAGFGRMQRQR